MSTITPKNLLSVERSMGKLVIFNVLSSSKFLARENIIYLVFLRLRRRPLESTHLRRILHKSRSCASTSVILFPVIIIFASSAYSMNFAIC